ncbi:TetR family transcriptional regulator [Nocardia sp. NPDC046763]
MGSRDALSCWRFPHDERGKHRYTVDQIAAEFGVTRPTIHRHLNKTTL